MKKFLLATTLIVAGVSAASAEVTLSGDARMGLVNGYVFDPTEDDSTTFTSRARVTFTLSGESDSGLSFGASFRADNAGDAAGGTAGSVFVTGAFGTLSMGDVDGAAAAAVGQASGVGLTGLGDAQEVMFVANGGLGGDVAEALDLLDANGDPVTLTGDPSVLYTYTTGGLSLYASGTLPGHVTEVAGLTGELEGEAYALGAAYSFDGYKVSLGYETVSLDEVGGTDSGDIEHIVVGADATLGGVGIQFRYGTADIDENGVAFAELEQASIAATYSMDSVAVTGFYAIKDFAEVGGTGLLETDAYGIGASYDLGGGASVKGGIARIKGTDGTDAVDDSSFDVGLTFSF